MRLDDLRDRIDELCDDGALGEYAVEISFDGNCFGIDRVEIDAGGAMRIYVEK